MRITLRELATVLAALRYWQSDLKLPDMFASKEFKEIHFTIAQDGGTLEPLTVEEIDKLCERINMGEEDEP